MTKITRPVNLVRVLAAAGCISMLALIAVALFLLPIAFEDGGLIHKWGLLACQAIAIVIFWECLRELVRD